MRIVLCFREFGMKGYLVSVTLLAVMFLMGVAVNKILKQRSTPTWALVTGFMALNATFFLFAYIFRAIGLSFSLLCRVYSVFAVLFLAVGLFLFFYRRNYKAYFASVTEFFSEKPIIKLVILAMIAGLFCISFCISLQEYPDTDDSFHFAKAMEFIKTDTLNFREFQAWLGWDDPVMHSSTDASTLNILYAYISVITGMHVAALCRKAIIISFSIIVYCVIFNLGISIFRDFKSKTRALTMLMLYMLLCALYNAVDYSVPYMQIYDMWHGNTMVCSIIFPCIMTVCMEIYCRGDSVKFSDWLLLALIIMASISVSIMGVNFTVIYCVVMAAPFLLYRLIKRKKIRQFILPMFIAMLPAIIFSGISLLTVVTSNQMYFNNFTPPDISIAFNQQFINNSHGAVLLLFIGGIIYFLLRGTLCQRLLLVGVSAFLALTFLNPLLCNIVAKYLTTSSIYWRLYWIFPIWTIAPAAVVDIVSRLDDGQRKPFIKGSACAFLAFVLLGYSYCGFEFSNLSSLLRTYGTFRTNDYALPEDTIMFADMILSDSEKDLPMLLDLSGPTQLYAIRQYTADIGLCFGIRNDQVRGHTELISGTDTAISGLVIGFRSGKTCEDADLLLSAIKQTGADYVFADESQLPENDFLEAMTSTGRYTLYRVKIAA